MKRVTSAKSCGILVGKTRTGTEVFAAYGRNFESRQGQPFEFNERRRSNRGSISPVRNLTEELLRIR